MSGEEPSPPPRKNPGAPVWFPLRSRHGALHVQHARNHEQVDGATRPVSTTGLHIHVHIRVHVHVIHNAQADGTHYMYTRSCMQGPSQALVASRQEHKSESKMIVWHQPLITVLWTTRYLASDTLGETPHPARCPKQPISLIFVYQRLHVCI